MIIVIKKFINKEIMKMSDDDDNVNYYEYEG